MWTKERKEQMELERRRETGEALREGLAGADDRGLERRHDAEKRAEPAPPQQQYRTDYDGLATEAFAEKAVAILHAPIDPEAVEIKPDGVVYLPWVFYAERMDKAFGPGAWGVCPRGPARLVQNTVMYHGALYVLGRFVRDAIGECQYFANNPSMTYASAIEGAESDCLTRCVKRLGVARELWTPAWREDWIRKYTYRAFDPQAGRKGTGGYIYWRKDREVPWQVTKGRLRSEPGRGPSLKVVRSADKERTDEELRREVDAEIPQPPGPKVGSDMEGRPRLPGAGTTRDATQSQIQEIDYHVWQTLKWNEHRATNWLKKHFGTSLPKNLTKEQAGYALQMLLAAEISDEEYARVTKQLQDMGAVK